MANWIYGSMLQYWQEEDKLFIVVGVLLFMTRKKGNETKMFGGKRFELSGVFTNKARAIQEADYWRSHKGWYARVTRDEPHSMSYAVWVHH